MKYTGRAQINAFNEKQSLKLGSIRLHGNFFIKRRACKKYSQKICSLDIVMIRRCSENILFQMGIVSY